MLIGLLHQNISCTLYEAAPAFAEIGAGVSFGPNAVRAMSLIDPEIKKGYDSIATSNAFPEKKKFWFDFSLGQKESGWRDLKAPGKEGVRIAQVGDFSLLASLYFDLVRDLRELGRGGKSWDGNFSLLKS